MPPDDWQLEMQRYLAHVDRAAKRPAILFTHQAHPAPVWTPALDMYETDAALVVLLDLSGVDAAKTEVRVEPYVLRVSGVRRAEQGRYASDEQRSYLALEIPYGRFERELRLPTGIDAEAAQATYRDGLLEIRLPKRLPRHVVVNRERLVPEA